MTLDGLKDQKRKQILLESMLEEEIRLMNQLFINLQRNNKKYANIKFSPHDDGMGVNIDFSRFYKIEKIKKILSKI